MEKKLNFKELTSFSNALSGMKIVAIVVSITAILSSVFLFVYYTNQISELNKQLDVARNQRFVFDPTSGFMLRGSFRMLEEEDRKNLYKSLVNRFIDCFYDFDGETFKDNLKIGTAYVSEDVANIKLSDYLEGKYNLGQKLLDEKTVWYAKVDSMTIRTDLKPIQGIVYARKKIVKPYGNEMYHLIGKFTIRDLDKITEKNEYAAIIDQWKIVDESIIEETE